MHISPIKCFGVAALILLLCARGLASETTHHWTVRVAGTDYGLVGYREYTPPYDRTEICYSSTYPKSFMVDSHIYVVALVAIVFGSIPPLLAAYIYARSRHRRRNAA
jgi:hypothetical protein